MQNADCLPGVYEELQLAKSGDSTQSSTSKFEKAGKHSGAEVFAWHQPPQRFAHAKSLISTFHSSIDQQKQGTKHAILVFASMQCRQGIQSPHMGRRNGWQGKYSLCPPAVLKGLFGPLAARPILNGNCSLFGREHLCSSTKHNRQVLMWVAATAGKD